ncbi:MAG: hypothetical protein C0469_09760 [Cyanobacteria bacterium DS2.3.42]|nr:hypothetical protein [Cyanobacteria bacterium DS2.3.42]
MPLSQSQANDDSSLLNQVQIAAPCHVDWDSMTGDERKRFCGDCKLNVYNVSTMSTKDAAQLIRESEGRSCLRLYRRKDGTIITDNCPVGLRNLRDRVLTKTATVTALFALLGLASGAQAQGQVMMGAVAPTNICKQAEPLSAVLTPWLVSASFLSSFGVAVLYIRKKARPLTIGLMLVAIWISAGFVAGISSGFSF